MLCNNLKLNIVNNNENTKFGKILSFRSEIMHEILTSIKGHNSITNA